MNRFVLTAAAVIATSAAVAQEKLTLQACHDMAIAESALSGQQQLYQDLASSKEQRLGLANRPQVSINGQWSYQSDVFSLPFSLPGSDVPEIPKSQYQATLGIDQSIYDGGITRQSREVAKRELYVNQQRVEIDLYKVKEAVNLLYFGLLRAQETEKSLMAAKNTLAEQKKVIDAGYTMGVMLPSDKAAFEKELLALEQQLLSVAAEKEALREMLSEKLGQPLSESDELLIPDAGLAPEDEADINRPEIDLIEYQQGVLSQSGELVVAKTRPRISAFARGGFGSPNPYNFFETDLNGFYIAGIRLYWPLFDWGASKSEKQEVRIQELLLENSRADAMAQFENGAIQWHRKWLASGDIISRDEQIVQLQESIVKEYAARLEGGTVTSAEYIAALDQLTRATVTAQMHQIDRAWYQVQYSTITGNL